MSQNSLLAKTNLPTCSKSAKEPILASLLFLRVLPLSLRFSRMKIFSKESSFLIIFAGTKRMKYAHLTTSTLTLFFHFYLRHPLFQDGTSLTEREGHRYSGNWLTR